MKKSAGIVGLGVLGSAIAQYLLEKDYEIYGYDIAPNALNELEKFENFKTCSSPANVLSHQQITLLCLPSAASLEIVVKDLSKNSLPHSKQPLLIELSTLPVDSKIAALKIAQDNNIRMVDSPVSGNRIVALNGKLSAYLSGIRQDTEIAKPLLDAFCQKVTEVGDFGNGSKMKLIGNILNLVHNSVTAEVMVLGMKVGLEPELIHKAISGTFSSSAVFEGRGKLMVDNNYAVEGMNFSTPIKDSDFITKLAKDHFVPLPLYQVALQYYLAAMAQGYEDLDAAAVCAVVEKNTNLNR
ncbi:MAG: NAD-binding protein [Alphaproteobacteria bacterium]|jgi:L-threonate 2-dehydrogenase|nr:NAD-binding protein [Alphaproteobacteria bacterium]